MTAARLVALLGPWHRPADAPGWAALALAAYFALRAATAGADEPTASRRRFLTIAGFAAAFLSLGYIAYYLRGGPRIIDATTYFLQGRALAHGGFTFPAPEVSASFRGRFLLFHEPGRLAGIFPPGYPLLLALGFLVGAPMVVGPALAAALAIATYALARETASNLEAPTRERVARLAVLLSILCAALRYHTADTMAHGASALGVTVALASALAARRTKDARLWALAGLAVGYVACTRMVSALPIGALTLALAWGDARRGRAIALAALAALPGLALLALATRAATGDALRSAQLAYYAASDGPPGCFRYGFGRGVGCLFEHGEFVHARLEGGYGALAALGTTARRLRMHLTDVANLEPLALLALFPAWRDKRARVAIALVLGQILAYAPFYFDGNYPGGGARFFADVLPVEHALVALSVARLAPRVPFARRAAALLALVALGFAVHASHEHLQLANRDGGRPMFEPDKLREAGITHGLVFFDTDHGFDLAHDPGELPSHGVLAARLRDDDHDKLLLARLGHPAAHVYKLLPDGPSVTPYTKYGALTDPSWRFESEADWPPLRQSNGWAEPTYRAAGCGSNGRVLTLHAAGDGARATMILELPVPRAGTWRIRPAYVGDGKGARSSIAVYHAVDHPLASWDIVDARAACEVLPARTAELSPPNAFVVVSTNAEISMDYVTIDASETGH